MSYVEVQGQPVDNFSNVDWDKGARICARAGRGTPGTAPEGAAGGSTGGRVQGGHPPPPSQSVLGLQADEDHVAREDGSTDRLSALSPELVPGREPERHRVEVHPVGLAGDVVNRIAEREARPEGAADPHRWPDAARLAGSTNYTDRVREHAPDFPGGHDQLAAAHRAKAVRCGVAAEQRLLGLDLVLLADVDSRLHVVGQDAGVA